MPPPNRPLRTLSIGGATYDLFLRMEATVEAEAVKGETLALRIGDKVQIDSVIERCGGGASNTAVGLARLGCSSAFCGVLGEDQWGQLLLENLRTEGVDVSHATVVEGETSSFSAILSLATGERTILYAPGVNAHLSDITFARDAIGTVDWVYLNHLCESSCAIEDDIVAALQSHPQVGLSWNPGGCQIRAGMEAKNTRSLLALTHLLLLNKEEALRFTGEDGVDAAVSALRHAGVRNVCITDGARGTLAADGDHRYHCPAAPVTVADATGAGDAFGTAATWTLSQGKPLPDALRAGTLNAASVLATIGAQPGLLTHTEIRAQLSEHHTAVEVIR